MEAFQNNRNRFAMKDKKNRSPRMAVGALSSIFLLIASIVVGGLVAWRYGDDMKRTFRAVVGAFIEDPPVSLAVIWVRGGGVLRLTNRSDNLVVARIALREGDAYKAGVSFQIPKGATVSFPDVPVPDDPAGKRILDFFLGDTSLNRGAVVQLLKDGDEGLISFDGYSKKLSFLIKGDVYEHRFVW